MSNVILMTTLKNRLTKASKDELQFALRNTKINGTNRGCVGFVTNLRTGKIAYVDTEVSSGRWLADKVLYRTAENVIDYHGGTNQWGERKNDAYIADILTLIG